MFALGIEFLTGTAVMTSADSREAAEWPPHPARVYMALVAAHYETRPLPEDGDAALSAWNEQRRCLQWLEGQHAPALHCADVPAEHRRTVVKSYVPVNDAGLPSNPAKVKEVDMRDALGVMPAFRSKQERTFPAVGLGFIGGRNQVQLIWTGAELPEDLLGPFEGLASKVTRIGHSSSLTSVWIAPSECVKPATLIPVQGTKLQRGGVKLRCVSPGLLAELDQRFNAEDINAFFDLAEQIKGSTGKAKAKAKETFKARFDEDYTSSSAPPVRRMPFVGASQTYVAPAVAGLPPISSVFDSEVLVLTKKEGRVLGLESTNLLVEALRGALLTGSENAPMWFTGHRAPGEPADSPHLALLPLSFVGSEFADGHILGMALAFPKTVDATQRATQLRRILFDKEGDDNDIVLKLGQAGTWTLQREDRASRSRPIALRAETWTEPSTVWASVTPVVLDRHPKLDPGDPEERAAWRQEVAEIVRASCVNIGLPRPIAVDVDKTSWHRGAPRSRPGPNGMPWLPTKMGGARQQIHVMLQFDREIEGPVLIGAGRYRGYGLCKPLGLSPS